jgi:hypothetical protein
MDDASLRLLKLLSARLERISADSVVAHHASGVRGSLLKMGERIENNQPIDEQKFRELTAKAFRLLNARRGKRPLKPGESSSFAFRPSAR